MHTLRRNLKVQGKPAIEIWDTVISLFANILMIIIEFILFYFLTKTVKIFKYPFAFITLPFMYNGNFRGTIPIYYAFSPRKQSWKLFFEHFIPS